MTLAARIHPPDHPAESLPHHHTYVTEVWFSLLFFYFKFKFRFKFKFKFKFEFEVEFSIHYCICKILTLLSPARGHIRWNVARREFERTC